jgi:hypothetical protein
MRANRMSLRMQIDKWLGPISPKTIRIIRMGYSSGSRVRCVTVESPRSSKSLAIVFFRHGDGSWLVYPPRVERPAMGAYLRAA